MSLQKALLYQRKAHKSQTRKRMMIDYYVHPIQVFRTAQKWGVTDEDALIAYLLHDVKEDNPEFWEEHKGEFSEKSQSIVEELTHYPQKESKENYMNSFETKSVWALIGKLADRYENLVDFQLTQPDYFDIYRKKAIPLFYSLRSRTVEVDEHCSVEKIKTDYDLIGIDVGDSFSVVCNGEKFYFENLQIINFYDGLLAGIPTVEMNEARLNSFVKDYKNVCVQLPDSSITENAGRRNQVFPSYMITCTVSSNKEIEQDAPLSVGSEIDLIFFSNNCLNLPYKLVQVLSDVDWNKYARASYFS